MLRKICLSILILLFGFNLCYGGLTDGTNCGFVLTAPTADPAVSGNVGDQGYNNGGGPFVSPSGTNTITSMGINIDDTVTSRDNIYELGIYSHDATNNRPNLLLASITGLTLGAAAGWYSGNFSTPYSITATTSYWLVGAFDNAHNVNIGWAAQDGYKFVYQTGSTLVSSWTSSSSVANFITALYAVYVSATTRRMWTFQ